VGRTPENKRQIVADLKESLSDTKMMLVVDYQGLTVAEITDLRNRLRPCGASCKVTKNTFMEIAIKEDDNWQPLSEYLSGSSAFLFVKDDLSGAIKAYKDFQKATKKTEIRGGVLEGKTLSSDEIKALGDLPPKEILMAQIAGALNALATKIAVGINEVPTSLARGLKAHAEKDAA
jgi:large subunit ribosomal protein L10